MKVDDQIEVKKIVKKSGSSFFWGMNVLDSERKRAMFSIYAFCRIVDDIADEIKNKRLKIEKLKSWKKKINNIFKSKELKSSIENELKFAVEKFQLERLDFYAIIDGMMMDARSDIKFPKKKILELYCDRVAVAVGYLSIRIFGLSEKGKKYAFYLGRAFQLTNIVRDFYEDLKRGRCYIASEYLSIYGVKKDIKTIEHDPKLQNILQDILHEANIFFEKSNIEAKKISKKQIVASEIMKTFYKAIHTKMFKKKIDIEKKIKLNYFQKIYILVLFALRY